MGGHQLLPCKAVIQFQAERNPLGRWDGGVLGRFEVYFERYSVWKFIAGLSHTV